MTAGPDGDRTPDDKRTVLDAVPDGALDGTTSPEPTENAGLDEDPTTEDSASPRRDPWLSDDDPMAQRMHGATPVPPEDSANTGKKLTSSEPNAPPASPDEPADKVVDHTKITVESKKEHDPPESVSDGVPKTRAGEDTPASGGVPKARSSKDTPVETGAPTVSPTEGTPASNLASDQGRSSRPSFRVVEGGAATGAGATRSEASRGDAPTRKQAVKPRAAKPRAERPQSGRTEPEPPPPRVNAWPWIIGIAVLVGVVTSMAWPESRPVPKVDRTGKPTRGTVKPGAGRQPPRKGHQPQPRQSRRAWPAHPEPDAGAGSSSLVDMGSAEPGPEPVEPVEPVEPTEPPPPRTGDPREPPPGTPPEIAAVFRKLPVSPADRSPIGGVGATGIHIDHIAMGEFGDGKCAGSSNRFSLRDHRRVSVCVRVVHPREKEELTVLWQKHGGSTRRSKIIVKPLHAYRTRGYLQIRKEYLGDWTVRILSTDGVELARHEFTIMP